MNSIIDLLKLVKERPVMYTCILVGIRYRA